MKQWAFLIVLIACVLAFYSASVVAVSDFETWCKAWGQDWHPPVPPYSTSTCIILEEAEVAVSGTLNIPNDEILNNKGTINNYGEIRIDHGFESHGIVNNYGTIDNHGAFYNYIYIDGGAIYNYGTINNHGSLFNWEGAFYNYGTLDNYNSFYNNEVGTIYNSGTINNQILFENNGTIYRNLCVLSVINGTIIGTGVIKDLDSCVYLPLLMSGG